MDVKKFGLTLSTFFALGYVVDFLWHFILPKEGKDLYLELLKIVYIGFTGFNIQSFFVGLVQIYIWGWIAAGVFGWLWNKFHAQKGGER